MSRKALVVGINNYIQAPLKGCINDAERMSTILSRNGNGSKNFHILTKLDISTSSNLKTLVSDLFSGNDDVALFYFSGHGFRNEDDGFLVTPDFTDSNMGLRMRDLLHIVNSSRCKNRIVFLDCCMAGSLGENFDSICGSSELAEGVTILTASRSNELAREYQGSGIVTGLILDALDGSAADFLGNITPAGIYSFVDRCLGPWEQRPVFKTNITGFVPLRTVVPQIPEEVIKKLTEYFPTPSEEFKLDPSYEDTNTPNVKHEILKPYAVPDHVMIFKNLQKLQSIGLIIPVGEDFMYFAAMKSKSCRLTALGYYYWSLVKRDKI